MRRLLAIAVAAAIASSSAAYAGPMSCPAMRARALPRCCCPPGGGELPRLTCCTDPRDASADASSPREHTERLQLAPNLAVVARIEPGGAFRVPVAALPCAVPPSTAGPPPLPLRI